MKYTLAVPLCFLQLSAAALARAAHPIESTIELLQELEEKVKQEGQTEELTYAKFESWCSNSAKTLSSAITAGETKADILESTVAAKTEQNATLSAEIDALSAELLKLEAAGKAADETRGKAAALYTSSDGDLASTITALEEAIAALEGAKTSTDALIQTKLRKLMVFPLLLERLGDSGMEKLFGSQDSAAPAPAAASEDILARGDYDAHTRKYKFKSTSVTELLKELKEKFESDRLENTKSETNSQNAHSLEKNARDSATQAAADAQEEKTTLLSDTLTALAEAKGSLADTQEDLKADNANLADTKKSCEMKKSEWAERSKIRENERAAMQEAIKILSEVTGVRTEAPKNPVLPPAPVAAEESTAEEPAADAPLRESPVLIQSLVPSPRMVKAINLLRDEGRRAHSRSLQQLAEEINAHLTGPFDDINNMIQKMIFRLMSEQKDEDDHKNWCDQEMSKTNTSITDKNEKITALSLKIEAGKASAQELTTEITTANEMVATLTAHMAEAEEIRLAGKEENELAIKDAKEAQLAITKATAVLEAHYKETGMMAKEAYEFLAKSATAKAGQPVELPENPSTWSSAYVGVADPAAQPGGVVAILKQISADFARMEADTMAQEEVDSKAYEEDKKSSEIEKARRSKEAEMKSSEKARVLDKVSSEEKALKHVSEELVSVEQYLKDLGPACVEGDSTYADRKAARASELSALKEAQVILAEAFEEKAPERTVPAVLASAVPAQIHNHVTVNSTSGPKSVPIQQLRR